MKPMNAGHYGPERGDDPVSIKNEHDIEVGRGTKGPSLHGNHTLENKRDLPDNMANEVDLDDDIGLSVRKAQVLDYIQGGGDGKGDSVEAKLSAFRKNNPNIIEHTEVDELYPKA